MKSQTYIYTKDKHLYVNRNLISYINNTVIVKINVVNNLHA